MMKGATTQTIVESFRLRRSYLQLGQTMQQILNEMSFTQHIIFVSLLFLHFSYMLFCFAFKDKIGIRTCY